MTEKRWTGIYKQAIAKLAAVMVTIAAIGCLTVHDYGVSWDEIYGTNSVWWNLNKITRNEPIPGIFEYDGTVFNVATETVFQVQKKVGKLLSGSQERSERLLSRQRFESKHAMTFLTALLLYLLVAVIVGLLCGAEFAWLGPVTLALFPRVWGHGFFNFKDIPFAALFTLCTLIGAYWVAQWTSNLAPETPRKRFPIGRDRSTLAAIAYGVCIGLLTGVRAAGLVVIGFPLLAYCLMQVSQRKAIRLADVLINFIPAVLTTFIVATICYPSSWSNPIAWFYRALTALSNYDWNGKVLFNGEFFEPRSLPWTYVPTWIGISVPVIFQVAFVLGLVILMQKYRRFSPLQQACIVLLLLQIFLLPTLAVVRRSVIYGEIRHFLFIMPGIAAIAAAAFIWTYQALPKPSLKWASLGFLAVVLLSLGAEMAALHPYEYLYFNRAAGGLPAANQRFETDYWGLSLRQGMEWINQHDRLPVLVGGPLHSAEVFADEDVTLRSFAERKLPPDLKKPFYYLSMYGGNRQFQSYFQECPTLYQVTRQEVPLAIVRRCE